MAGSFRVGPRLFGLVRGVQDGGSTEQDFRAPLCIRRGPVKTLRLAEGLERLAQSKGSALDRSELQICRALFVVLRDRLLEGLSRIFPEARRILRLSQIDPRPGVVRVARREFLVRRDGSVDVPQGQRLDGADSQLHIGWQS